MQVIIDIPDASYNRFQTDLKGLDPKQYILNMVKDRYIQVVVYEEGAKEEQSARQEASQFTVQ